MSASLITTIRQDREDPASVVGKTRHS
jgi:hypothetical protein